MLDKNCPIITPEADGQRCSYVLDGRMCPEHGEVEEELQKLFNTRMLTLEKDMRKRKGLPPLCEDAHFQHKPKLRHLPPGEGRQ